MRKVEYFGIIPIKKEGSDWKVLLILHAEGNHWGFPKGKANPGETALESACRELKEETNLEVQEIIESPLLEEHYQFRHKREQISKTAHYFPALVSGELKCQEEEIREAIWCSFPEALNRLSFKQARHILCETMRLLNIELPDLEN